MIDASHRNDAYSWSVERLNEYQDHWVSELTKCKDIIELGKPCSTHDEVQRAAHLVSDDYEALYARSFTSKMNFNVWLRLEQLRRDYVCQKWWEVPGERQDAIYLACKDSFKFWCNNFGYTFDPRESKAPHVLPCVLWKFQEEYANVWIDGRDDTGRIWPIIGDKSRDMGISWISLKIMGWEWNLHGHSFGLISRTEADVDDSTDTTETLFGKLKFIMKWQPRFLTGKYQSKYMMLSRVRNGIPSSIRGTSTVDDAFRSKRYRRVFIDEANMIPGLANLMASVNDVSEGPVMVSSARGMDKHFAKVIHGKVGRIVQEGGTGVGTMHMRFHYSRHPDRNQSTERGREWKKREMARRQKWEWDQEQEISYTANMPSCVFSEFSREKHLYTSAVWDEHISHRLDYPSTEWGEGWDFADSSVTCRVTGAYIPSDDVLLITDYAHWMQGKIDRVASDVGASGYQCASNPHGRKLNWRVGDSSGNKKLYKVGGKQHSSSSWIDNLGKLGIKIQPYRVRTPGHTIKLVQSLLRDGRIRFSPRCAEHWGNVGMPTLIDCIESQHWAGATDGSVAYAGPDMEQDKGDYSHLCDGFMYLVWRFFGKDQSKWL